MRIAWWKRPTAATPMRRTASTRRMSSSSRTTSAAARRTAKVTPRRGTTTSTVTFMAPRTTTAISRPSASGSCSGSTPTRSSAGDPRARQRRIRHMADYSWKELMAVVFAREIKDTDKITSGAHTETFFAATMLAQKTHAPNLKLQLGGGVVLCNVADLEVPELPKTSTGYELIRYAESVHDHPDTYLFYGAPGGKRYYEGDAFADVNHFWFADKFFVGGIQADKWGNTNMIGLGKPGKMTFRGPGTIGINDIAVGVRDTYVFLTAHDKRRLVEKVDFISHPGKKVCRENEFYGDGPKWIVTPKCIF